jgi:site-specific recombinase XerD
MEQQTLVLPNAQLGPLAEYVNAYTTLIQERGYSVISVQTQVQLIRRFSQWLQRRHSEIYALDEALVQRFLRSHRSAYCARRGDAAALYRFLHMLREQGATRQKKPSLSLQQRLTTNYGRYLLDERGLTRASVVNYVPLIDQFLSARFPRIPIKLSQLRAPDVTEFVRHPAHKLSPGRAQLLVSALRSFLRYLRHQGKITADLATCVPTVARWSFASLPKFLSHGTVQTVLRRNDCRTPAGRRNYAILLLLARLGLRASCVLAAQLHPPLSEFALNCFLIQGEEKWVPSSAE